MLTQLEIYLIIWLTGLISGLIMLELLTFITKRKIIVIKKVRWMKNELD